MLPQVLVSTGGLRQQQETRDRSQVKWLLERVGRREQANAQPWTSRNKDLRKREVKPAAAQFLRLTFQQLCHPWNDHDTAMKAVQPVHI